MLLTELSPTLRGKISLSDKRNNSVICKPLKEVEREILLLKQRGAVIADFSGEGEGVENHPQISEIISFSLAERIHPVIYTEGQNPEKIETIIKQGCSEFLVSLDRISEHELSSKENSTPLSALSRSVELFDKYNCYKRISVDLTSSNFKNLPELLNFAIEKIRPYIVSIFANRFKITVTERVFNYQEAASYLVTALKLLNSKNIYTTLYYFPFCFLKGFEEYITNIPQELYDDFLDDRGILSKTQEILKSATRERCSHFAARDGKCSQCGILNICGGIDKAYSRLYGESNLTPYEVQDENVLSFKKDLEADIIIPVYAGHPNLPKLLSELAEKTQPPYNLILCEKNQSAAKNRNYGLNRSKSRFIIMCDDDIQNLPPAWNRILIKILRGNANILALSARLMNKDGSVGRNSANNYDLSVPIVEVPMIPTACCIFRESETRFDERYVRAGFEDTDFFRQLKENNMGAFAITNLVKVTHLNEEKNSGGVLNEANYKLFISKWGHF